MPTRSRTLRKLPQNTRKYYRLCDELDSVLTRFKNFRPTIHDLEFTAKAEINRELIVGHHPASIKVSIPGCEKYAGKYKTCGEAPCAPEDCVPQDLQNLFKEGREIDQDEARRTGETA